MPRKSNRYEIFHAAASGDWGKITPDALAGLDLKNLRKLLGSIPRLHARSEARDAVLDLIRQEIKHAKNQSLGPNDPIL